MSVPSTREEMPVVSQWEIPSESSSPAASSVSSSVPCRPSALSMSPQISSENKRKLGPSGEHPSVAKRFKGVVEEDLPTVSIHRTTSSSEHVPRVTPSARGLPRSMTYPRDTPRIHSRPKYPGPYLKNYTRLSMRNKISPGTFKLRRRTSTDPRPSEISFRVSSSQGEEIIFPVGAGNKVHEATAGECIVDFLCCSHDVTLYKVLLSFDGKLEIKDQSFKSLRTVVSATGQFVLKEPLVLQARKPYRIYFDSRFESVAPYRGTTWEIQFEGVTVEWGQRAIVGGMQLIVSS